MEKIELKLPFVDERKNSAEENELTHVIFLTQGHWLYQKHNVCLPCSCQTCQTGKISTNLVNVNILFEGSPHCSLTKLYTACNNTFIDSLTRQPTGLQ